MKHRHRHKTMCDSASNDDAGGSTPRLWYVALLLVAMLATGGVAQAKKRPQGFGLSGLAVSVDAGLLIPSDKQAFFYDGRDERLNTIRRLLGSQTYGEQIWNALQNSSTPLIGVGSYSQITIAEYPTMDFRLTYQIGLGLRYDYDGGWGWFLRFDYSRVRATGQFLINRTASPASMTNQGSYVVCDMVGQENRIYIDLGLDKRFLLGNGFELEIGGGLNVNNTKVQKQYMVIAGQSFSILNVWDGDVVQAGAGSYEYQNQGRLGIGFFGSVALCYAIANMGSVDVGYTLYRTQTRYIDISGDEATALQHVVFLRMSLNNFSFFGS